MNNSKITSHPPKKAIHEFILEAEKKVKYQNDVTDSHKDFPWNADNIRDDVQKAFTVKLPEEYLIKIKYISEKTHKSQQKLAREVLINEIDNMLKNLN
jgi:primase-polymerase (primpol)-like protein